MYLIRKIMEDEPMRLLDIPNIGSKRVHAIINSCQKHKNIKDLIIFLSDRGVSTSIAHKIYKGYGKESTKKFRENPYGIVQECFCVKEVIKSKSSDETNPLN